MIVELSPVAYLALCGLVQDALEHPSDATPLLERVARELANAKLADGTVPDDVADKLEQLDTFRRTELAA